MNRRRTARFAATIVLSYCLSVFLFCLITAVILIRTVVNPWYIVRQIERSGFPEQAVPEIQDIYISYGLGSGISRELMASLITATHISTAAEGSVLGAYKIGAGYDFDRFSNEVYLILHNYITLQGIYVDDEIETGLRDLADLCAVSLRDYVDSPILGVLAQTQRYSHLLTFTIIASTFISLTAIVIIPVVNRRVTRWIDGYMYALGATFLMCLALPVTVFSLGLTSRLQIDPLSFNKLISSWISGILNSYLIALIPLLLLIGICITVRVTRWKKRKNLARRTRFLKIN